MKAQPDVSKIIVNKNKLNELKNNHVIPQNVSVFDPVKARLGINVGLKTELKCNFNKRYELIKLKI